MKFFTVLLIVVSFGLLSGCAMMGDQSKPAAPVNTVSTTAAPEKKCNQWCHNGWCSTTCEPSTGAAS